jgi:hypothetical protein
MGRMFDIAFYSEKCVDNSHCTSTTRNVSTSGTDIHINSRRFTLGPWLQASVKTYLYLTLCTEGVHSSYELGFYIPDDGILQMADSVQFHAEAGFFPGT